MKCIRRFSWFDQNIRNPHGCGEKKYFTSCWGLRNYFLASPLTGTTTSWKVLLPGPARPLPGNTGPIYIHQQCRNCFCTLFYVEAHPLVEQLYPSRLSPLSSLLSPLSLLLSSSPPPSPPPFLASSRPPSSPPPSFPPLLLALSPPLLLSNPLLLFLLLMASEFRLGVLFSLVVYIFRVPAMVFYTPPPIPPILALGKCLYSDLGVILERSPPPIKKNKSPQTKIVLSCSFPGERDF